VVNLPECEADHLPPFSSKVKNAWSYIFTPPYVFMTRDLVKADGQLFSINIMNAYRQTLFHMKIGEMSKA